MEPNTHVFDLADAILGKLIESPENGYGKDDLCKILSISHDDMTMAHSALSSKKYVENLHGYVCITDEGIYFYLTGGFRKQQQRERLMVENVEASIRSFEISEKVSKLSLWVACASLAIAIITLFAFLYQVFCLR